MVRHLTRSKIVKICLKGKCKTIQVTPNNGEPSHCEVRVELDHDIPLTYRAYDIKLQVPIEFAILLQAGKPLTLTLDQDEMRKYGNETLPP